MSWHKSTYSRALGNCVEVGTGHALVAVRDSQDPDGPVIDVSAKAWTEFTKHVKRATRLSPIGGRVRAALGER